MLDVFVERYGPDAVLFASDYPHWDAEWPGCVAAARKLAAPLGVDAVEKVMGTNAQRFYRLHPVL
jgi:hypothetical protein